MVEWWAWLGDGLGGGWGEVGRLAWLGLFAFISCKNWVSVGLKVVRHPPHFYPASYLYMHKVMQKMTRMSKTSYADESE